MKKLSKMAVVFGSLLFLCLNCTSNTSKTVVQIEDKALSNTELNQLTLASNLDTNNAEDIEVITDNWINTKKRELYLQEINPEALAQAKKQLLDFEQSIYTMYLENQIIKEQLDTLVTDEEILLFYNKNRAQYAQKNFIVKALYLKVTNETPEIEGIKKAFMLKNDKDVDQIKNFANLYASNFYFEQNKWIFFEDLVKEIPFEIDKNRLIVNREAYSVSDEKYTYFINILDYKVKTANAPIRIEKERIKERILAKRIKELRKTIPTQIETSIEQKYEVKYNLD